jgi:hypothetical protein
VDVSAQLVHWRLPPGDRGSNLLPVNVAAGVLFVGVAMPVARRGTAGGGWSGVRWKAVRWLVLYDLAWDLRDFRDEDDVDGRCASAGDGAGAGWG